MGARVFNLLLFAALCLAPGVVRAQDDTQVEETRYFYKGLPYGSDATFNPVRELVNGSFGILQISSRWMTLGEIDWRNGMDVTWKSVSHPVRTVNAYGWGNFLTSEVVPGQLRWSNLQYLPNYHLHLIGGGARHRGFVEWYRGHGFPNPGFWAAATTALHAVLVETVEHQAAVRPTVDPVADMLIFDPAGAILFSSDRVARFFSRTLNMSIWSGQPMYNSVRNTIENAGENYGFHIFFSRDARTGLFMYWGMSDLIGVTVRSASGLAWSVGVGGMASELKEADRGAGMSAIYANLKWDAGAFVHRNGSLLASVQVSEGWTQALRVNLYPGVVSLAGISPGIYVGVRNSDLIVGLSLATIPLGIAVSQ
jgi:hypothetical protein